MKVLIGLLLAGAVLLPAADYSEGHGKTGPRMQREPMAAAWTPDRALQQQATVGDILPGVPIDGVLEESDARSVFGSAIGGGRFADNYRLVLTSGQTLRIEMRSTEVDAYVYIFDLEGFDLGSNNDDGGGFAGTNSRLDFTLAAGEYVLQATTARSEDGGAYTLSVEVLGPAKPAAPLSLGQTVQGVLEPADNRTIFSFNTYADHYELSVPTAQTVDISAESNAFDTLLALTGLTGGVNTLLESDDDGGSGSNSAMSVDLEPGRYLVEISAFAEGEVGAYTLSVGGTAPAGPEMTAAGVVSSASFLGGAVVPGEILSFFGTGIGPAALTTLQLNANNMVATELGGTRILFDGQPAAMVFAVSTQASAIAPFSLAGQASTTIQVEVYGQRSAPITVPVAAAKPAIFTLNQSGTGPGAVLNQDFSVNSAANPAARGAVVQIFLTGGGVTNPASEGGSLAPSVPPFAELTADVSVSIGGQPAQVVYAGGAPGLVNGLVQVNAVVAGETPVGDAVEIVISVGGAASQSGVTIAVR